MACTLRGIPIWFTGPHPGATADVKLWKKYRPLARMAPQEQWLADKAYTDRSLNEICQQYKMRAAPPPNSTREQAAAHKSLRKNLKKYNNLHGTYRGVIENVFGMLLLHTHLRSG